MTEPATHLVFEDPPAPRQPAAPRQTERKPLLEYVAPDSSRPHGSYVKFVAEKCRCPDCRAAHREYNRRRIRAIHRPDEVWMPYVPAGPARRHIRWLATQGIGLKTVAKVSGVSHGCLWKLIYGAPDRSGPSKRIRHKTAAAILAVRPDHAAGGQKIDAAPTWKLLDEIIALDYPKVWIARQLGQHGQGLQVSKTRVLASTARAVEDLHRRIGGRPGPGKRTRWRP